MGNGNRERKSSNLKNKDVQRNIACLTARNAFGDA